MMHKNVRPSFHHTVAALFLLALLLLPGMAQAKALPPASSYDILYIWDTDLSNLQDYKEELESQLGDEVGKKLRIVQRGDRYGIIYDRNTTALSAAKLAVRHSSILGKVGLGDARAIEDEGYHELYNVCYGRGPNLEVLTEQYQVINSYLGAEVGKELFIEKSDDGKFTLIYRRQGDKQSTMALARRHAKLLAKIHVAASITREENNEVVFGESSLLDHEGKDAEAAPGPCTPEPPVANKQNKAAEAVPVLAGVKKLCVSEIRAGTSSDLEKQLEEYINELRRTGKVAKDEKTGWLVIDLTKGETLVDINVDSPYQAASMIKPFIALAYFHRLKEGKLTYGSTARKKMEAMIQRSSNAATNWVLKQVGGPKAAQKILSKHYGHLLRETTIVEYIPSGGRTYRNKASAKDYGRFLVALWRKDLPHGEELRRLMALPGRDRLYCGTSIPRGTLVYNKTGTTARLCGDMGILAPQAHNGRRYPYVVVGIIEKQNKASNYGRWKMARSNVIRKVSSMIYQAMKTNYNLR
ncbi:MAG: class A beta-lactamase-related serine hydrolase [Desulfobulbaceae bacterium]|nr:class A beta-lactamase-related serine hydrolase [Desulfobulbaceae bacterium]HIJ91264.1 serine hydrolase [Deltaproteobacteria bacterium]